MKWSFLSFERGTVYIDGTKNKTSSRYIPLFESLKVLLKNIPKNEVSEYMFNLSYNMLRRDYRKLQEN